MNSSRRGGKDAVMPATSEVNLELLGPHLTLEQAEQIFQQGKEAVIFALLEFSKLLAEQQRRSAQQSPTPSTPSGMIPTHLKPAIRERRKKPGRKRGHTGVRRPPPDRIDRRE